VPKPDPKNPLEVGERVYLREPTKRDGPQIVAANRLSRAFHRGWVRPPTDSEAFARWMSRCRQPNVRCFLVCRSVDGAIVGVFILSEIVRGMFHSTYLGFYAGRPYAGQGYMTEGMRLVLRHAFTTMKLHRVEANVQPENAASIALVKRSGFRLEGFSPRYLKVAGRWRDHQRWAILIDDWRRLRRRQRAPSRYLAPRSRPVSLSPDTLRSG
jgi:ribosomal-protein-alanine N-acetyltransferase